MRFDCPLVPRWLARVVVASGLASVFALASTVALGGEPSPPRPGQARTSPSLASDRKQKAAAAKARGDEAINALRFADALAAYEEAYGLEPSPALLYNRGRALQLLDRMPEALDAFEQFQREASPELLQRVARFDELLAEVRGKVATLTLTAHPDGVEVVLDGRALGTTPLSAPLRLNRKNGVVLELRKEGHHSVERRLDLVNKPTQELSVTLQPKDVTALLIVKAPVGGAAVRIDGRASGNAPSESYLQPGPHRVVVTRDGFEDAEIGVVLQKGERKAIDVALEPATPIYKRWWLWTAVGAAVVTGVTLGIVLNIERGADNGTLQPGQISAPLITF